MRHRLARDNEEARPSHRPAMRTLRWLPIWCWFADRVVGVCHRCSGVIVAVASLLYATGWAGESLFLVIMQLPVSAAPPTQDGVWT